MVENIRGVSRAKSGTFSRTHDAAASGALHYAESFVLTVFGRELAVAWAKGSIAGLRSFLALYDPDH